MELAECSRFVCPFLLKFTGNPRFAMFLSGLSLVNGFLVKKKLDDEKERKMVTANAMKFPESGRTEGLP